MATPTGIMHWLDRFKLDKDTFGFLIRGLLILLPVVLLAGLRQKLEQNPNEPRWIQTVHGVGYFFKHPDEGKV